MLRRLVLALFLVMTPALFALTWPVQAADAAAAHAAR